MKKVLLSITLLCYLAVSCGVVINFHYCMNRLASTEVFASASTVCSKCGMHTKKSSGCCRDEVKVVKMQEDQQNAHAVYSLQAPEPAVIVPSGFIDLAFYNYNLVTSAQVHPPPLLTAQDTYLQNCVFRI